MKKLLTTTLLLASVTAFGSDKVENKSVQHDASVKLQMFTQNPNLDEKFRHINVGYELEGKYKLNKNFSATLKGVMLGRDRYELVPGVGAEMNITKHFTPYARVEAPVYLFRGRNHRLLDYKFGIKYNVYNGLYFYGESHEFFEAYKAGYEVGTGFFIAKDLVFSAAYHTQIKGHYNGLKASVEYII